mmetsp:Transcript_16051/g.32915  ORF Transcript_16051/g.32915 Transcript_16051/m.32915 type:complete len:1125 (+) Transcript_16051:240-3614(+)|eukprot:CAMPEP_0118639642 /NCGR_PEP_ID=MMETSP0785-20121206/4329_1 /TAXON_ID=91992 /ORGANISM="Bolidomonas pacifica, Strain CCMP 1866" /LENGTH=1124 /DNA_ID=CAMNT_0006530977 /DNA_START=171 /DNA_END=3545 /DNA_ORIENTATION=-
MLAQILDKKPAASQETYVRQGIGSEKGASPSKKAWEGEYKSFLSRLGWKKGGNKGSTQASSSQPASSLPPKEEEGEEYIPGPPSTSKKGNLFTAARDIFRRSNSFTSNSAGDELDDLDYTHHPPSGSYGSASGGGDDLDCSRHTQSSVSSYSSSNYVGSPSKAFTHSYNSSGIARSLPNPTPHRGIPRPSSHSGIVDSFPALSLASIKEEHGKKASAPVSGLSSSLSSSLNPSALSPSTLHPSTSRESCSSSDFKPENDMMSLVDDNAPTPQAHNMYSKSSSGNNSFARDNRDEDNQDPRKHNEFPPTLVESAVSSRSNSGNNVSSSNKRQPSQPPAVNYEKAVKGGNIFGALFAKPTIATDAASPSKKSKGGIESSPQTPDMLEDLGAGVMSPLRAPLPPAATPAPSTLTKSTTKVASSSLPIISTANFPYQTDVEASSNFKQRPISPSNQSTASSNNGSFTSDQIPRDKSLRAAFTAIHNSQQFGQDSTSAFLGDDLSVHHGNDFGLMFNGNNTTTINNNDRGSGASLPLSASISSFSSSLQSLDEHNPTLLPSSLACYPLLLPMDDIDSWNVQQEGVGKNGAKVTSSSGVVKPKREHPKGRENNFILPAVMHRSFNLCPSAFKAFPRGDFFSMQSPAPSPPNKPRVAPPSPPTIEEPTISLSTSPDFGYYDDASSSPPPSPVHTPPPQSKGGPFKPISLGHVYMSPIAVITNVNVASNLQSRHLTIQQNYLFEYDAVNNTLPLGFAHLEDSVIKKVDTTSFDLSFLSGKGEVHNVTIRCRSEVQCSYICYELKYAANLAIDNLYKVDMSEEGDHVLGKGRFACVKKTTRVDDNRTCAVKIIDKANFWARVVAGKERKDTLVRELTVQTALTHFVLEDHFKPVFVEIYGVFETKKHLVIEMECMSGGSAGEPGDLFQLLKQRNSKLSEKDASDFIFNILMAVRSMRSLGIAHRDIKLANLLTTGEKDRKKSIFVKLGDYGMSDFIDPSNFLLYGRCGTPGYVAPEILRAKKNEGYKNKVDLFSVGVVMYTLLCGYEPFYGESDGELVKCNKKAKIYFDEDWEDVSENAKLLIKRLCDPDPRKRIGPEEALKSPWFKDCKDVSYGAVGRDITKQREEGSCAVM